MCFCSSVFPILMAVSGISLSLDDYLNFFSQILLVLFCILFFLYYESVLYNLSANHCHTFCKYFLLVWVFQNVLLWWSPLFFMISVFHIFSKKHLPKQVTKFFSFFGNKFYSLSVTFMFIIHFLAYNRKYEPWAEF